MYLEAVRSHIRTRGDGDPLTDEAIQTWQRILDALASDPTTLANELDWVAKLSLIQRYRERDGLQWDDPQLGLIDLQYSDIRPEKGLYHRLVARSKMKTLIPAHDVNAAVTDAPDDTRAWFRGECIRKFSDSIFAASWDSIVFEIGREESLQRIATTDPFKGTKAALSNLIDKATSAEQLITALQTGQGLD